MIIDRDRNQILDESAIPMSAIMAELERYAKLVAQLDHDLSLTDMEVERLNKELAKKQSIIDQFQVDDYFRVNYPNGHPNDRNETDNANNGK